MIRQIYNERLTFFMQLDFELSPDWSKLDVKGKLVMINQPDIDLEMSYNLAEVNKFAFEYAKLSLLLDTPT